MYSILVVANNSGSYIATTGSFAAEYIAIRFQANHKCTY